MYFDRFLILEETVIFKINNIFIKQINLFN